MRRVKGIEPSSQFRTSTDGFLLDFFTVKLRWTPPNVSTNVSTRMASIHRRPRSPYWHGAFRQAGKLVLRSTGSTDKAVARRIADEWEQIAHQAEAGTHIEQQTQRTSARVPSDKDAATNCNCTLRGWKSSNWLLQERLQG